MSGFKSEEKGSTLLIHCPTEIDALMGKQIAIQQSKWIGSGAETIALNFSHVESVDAEGLRYVSLLSKAAKEANIKFVTLNPSKNVLKMLRKQGLELALNPLTLK